MGPGWDHFSTTFGDHFGTKFGTISGSRWDQVVTILAVVPFEPDAGVIDVDFCHGAVPFEPAAGTDGWEDDFDVFGFQNLGV